MSEQPTTGPIGVFDSGYGGLTILRSLRETLPEYDYLYLGDNARAPYGTRSFDIVTDFTRQAVDYLFSRGCKGTAHNPAAVAPRQRRPIAARPRRHTPHG